MTAPDDDQDLVTIRIPRRAAALYAAELDVIATPWAVTLGVYVQFTIAIIAVLLGIGLLLASVIACFNQTFDSAAIFGGVGLGFTFGGIGLTALAVRFRRALKHRAIL